MMRRISLAVLGFSILACGTLQVSVVGTETPNAAITGTVGALQTQNSELATRVAMVAPATGASTRTAPNPPGGMSASETAAAPSATRINFLSGATVGVVTSPIAPGQTQTYIVDVFQAQPMFVYVGSANNDVTVSIFTENGQPILSPGAHQISWQGSLPRTGDYYLTVHGGASIENFSLTVTIPSRVQFTAGSDSATLSGKTVAGYNVGYTVYARKGQTMSVDLENLSSKASISIYGFTDGQSYLRSDKGQKSYQFVLPVTQDYVITVVPMDGLVVSYIMTIKIQ